VEDARDFDRMFSDLINNDVGQGREHQLPPSGHSVAGSAKVGKFLQAGASVIDRSRNSPGCFRIVAFYPFADALQIVAFYPFADALQVFGLSRLQEAL
jgi:hypothetical protein